MNQQIVTDNAVLAPDEMAALDASWRAANYLSVGQIYLLDNPLLRVPLRPEHIKPRPLGHWGTTPGLNFIYTHLNRMIRSRDLDMIFIAGPGHGGPALNAQTWLEGTYSRCWPDVTRDEYGMRKLFRRFSFPGGVGSHATPEVPGSIHEGGELGYSLSHAFGAAFDNPSLTVCCVIGDGEAETGPLAAAWHSNKFLNPATDGVVLPILHLNGYKIANPTVLARIPREELTSLLVGYGYKPYFVEGDDPPTMHQAMAATLERIFDDIRDIKAAAHAGHLDRPAWPLLVLKTPKGWTGPKSVAGLAIEGSFRSHQVPFGQPHTNAEQLALLDAWLKSYRPAELFDAQGAPGAGILGTIPGEGRRMGDNPHANGGALLSALRLPSVNSYALKVSTRGSLVAESTSVLGNYLRDLYVENAEQRNFRLFGPDEIASNRLGAVLDVSRRTWMAEMHDDDDRLSKDGRVMEILSEHTCQGWLEGYLLTGRHGLFASYEAFIHVVDSMFNQHAKWLKVAREVPWRKPIASLNILLTSHVWRQDHNGFSHQDPGFIDHVVNKKATTIRVYLPPDANTLLCVAECCLQSRNLVNVIVAGKHPAPQWLTMPEAMRHCAVGASRWAWASNEDGREPDVVMACAGDVPTAETLAAVDLLRSLVPELRIRTVNVMDLMTLQSGSDHPHGLSDESFDKLFTRDRPVLFVYHGYPWLIHRLTYRRHNHDNFHVRGYIEEGTTTTPFDMAVLNRIDRFNLVKDVVSLAGLSAESVDGVRREMDRRLEAHRAYIRQYGEDMPVVRDWCWSGSSDSVR